ncbi:type I site-specific restriction-modificationsystem [Striga asiatica]|uniref:Type I site-specific restriction-modificationsystem n=1 Tax=Striga asiatica TaxID=4170 RepID=A0A5A7QT76_STRAF|nr:type I site-specific restriction-modificationsystem [Striga asiatica]
MAVNSSEECQNVHSVVVLPDGGPTNMHYEPTSNTTSVEVPRQMKSQTCLSSDSLLNFTKVDADKVNNYTPFVLDVDIEKGKAELPKSNEDCVVNLKSDDSFASIASRVLLPDKRKDYAAPDEPFD